MPKSAYLCNKILDHLHGGTTYTAPATTYFALMTAAPSSLGGGTEVTGGGYARVAFTNNVTNWPAAASSVKVTGTILDWGTSSGAWGTIVAIAEYDASSGGNLLNFGLLSTPITVSSGQPFSVPAGSGVFTET